MCQVVSFEMDWLGSYSQDPLSLPPFPDLKHANTASYQLNGFRFHIIYTGKTTSRLMIWAFISKVISLLSSAAQHMRLLTNGERAISKLRGPFDHQSPRLGVTTRLCPSLDFHFPGAAMAWSSRQHVIRSLVKNRASSGAKQVSWKTLRYTKKELCGGKGPARKKTVKRTCFLASRLEPNMAVSLMGQQVPQFALTSGCSWLCPDWAGRCGAG